MDPDAAADADHGVQRDGGGGIASSSADGCCCGDGGGIGWARALLLHLLRGGWRLSRTAAIAGVAATAAPPLIVLSVAGVALSLPFAAYLATLAATDRLMGALLPPAPRPYLHDRQRDDVVSGDAPAPQEPRREVEVPAVVEDNWSDEARGGGGAVREEEYSNESERYASLPLSREPRPSSQASMPRDEDDNVVERWVQASAPAEEPTHQSSSLPDDNSGDKTEEDTERTATKEMESLDITVESNDSQVPPALGKVEDNLVVQREVEGETSLGKSLPNVEDKSEAERHKAREEEEEMPLPLHEVGFSEGSSSVPQRKIEGDVTVGMVIEDDVTIMNTDPAVTGEVTDDGQMGSIATALPLPESESLQASDLVAWELQGMPEAACVDDILQINLTEDIVLDIAIGDTNVEVVDRHGEGGVSSAVAEDDVDTGCVDRHGEGGVSTVVSLVNVDDVTDLVSSRTDSTPVQVIGDDTRSVECQPDVDQCNRSTDLSTTNKELQEKEVVEDKYVKKEGNKTVDNKVSTRSMEPQNIGVSKSPVPDDQSKKEGEVTVEMVLEEMTGSASDLVVGELIAGRLNIIGSEREESLPLSDHTVADELQAVSKAAHARSHDAATSAEGMPLPNVDRLHQRTAAEYELANERFQRNVVAEDMGNYTEEQLREQLDTLRTITGYRTPLPLTTLEAELAGLYVFVGVEPPLSSRDASDLNDLSAKLRFLKSIIGVD